MKIIASLVIHAPDNCNVQDISNGVSSFLITALNEESLLGEEVHLAGFGVSRVLGDQCGVEVTIYDKDMLTVDSYLDMTREGSSGNMYVVRVPIEGIESHVERFNCMDGLIQNMGGDPEEEHSNVWFIFDTGSSDDFSRLAMSLLISPNKDSLSKAHLDGISFSQWIPRSKRDGILNAASKKGSS